ncbi:glycosyl hydrolase 115 family protein [Gilvimarinus chinensis]|uniref:glycosyl hydrolase 115 family protein n=1 Tax=Gilvimarinus chinensis TaxID=396005 RepID=UPI000370A300|nr:glycosyl hydrolase 115 family protein [Gilvimarinus chinensis]
MNMPRLLVFILTCILPSVSLADSCEAPASVCFTSQKGALALIKNGAPLAVLSDKDANPAVQRVAQDFADDLRKISGAKARQVTQITDLNGPAVLIGEVGKNQFIDSLVKSGKLDVSAIRGKWEGYVISVIDEPWPNVPRALIVAGADRRGAVFGSYELSEAMEVSPWYWFADVPVKPRENVYITPGSRVDWPEVRYRGIFINDEDPALSSWAKQRFGGVNSKMYERVFELILRLKGNYIWPAMWYPKAFHLDDPKNKVLADDMGIVMGTSHHEPLTRAQSEWHRIDSDVTGGAWDYQTNAENLREFWRGGIERMMSKGDGQGYENLVTVGMRGDGDMPMAEGTAIDLLETIVTEQRDIIAEVTGKPASATPQVWALYKEVQDYYDQGMTVPDDITLLFADDNWGQIRRLPTKDLDRAGGFGVYYHFDYVGVPRNYKWLNTQQIQQVWQQMNLAYERHARDLWVVNVGDIKPMEYPLDFFMKMAWQPSAMDSAALEEFPVQWASRSFGANVADDVAELMTEYSRLASRRTPELLNESTFPVGPVAEVLDGQEFGRIVADWRALVARLESVKKQITPEQHSAFFQLIEYPILAFSNLYELYYATAWNRRLASHHDPRANHFIPLAESAFARDAELTGQYHALNNGKWDGMMNQVHMNYVIWNEPTQQTLPVLTRVAADAPVDKHVQEIVFADPYAAKDNKHIVIDATQFSRNVAGKGVAWTAVEHLGQGRGAMLSVPQGQPSTTVEDNVRLEYDFSQNQTADVEIRVNLSPTLDTRNAGGIRLGVSIDEQPVHTLISTLQPTAGGVSNDNQADWVEAVSNSRHTLSTKITNVTKGQRTLKLWRLDDNILIENIELVAQ